MAKSKLVSPQETETIDVKFQAPSHSCFSYKTDDEKHPLCFTCLLVANLV